MKSRSIAAMVIFLLFISVNCYAQQNSIGLKLSTLGYGLEGERAFTDSISGRIGANYASYTYSGTEEDVKYDIDLSLQSISLLLDWHPFRNSFRLSGGAVFNGNSISMDAKPSDTYKLGDTEYTSADIGDVEGRIDFEDVSPYLGLGWDTSYGKEKRFGFLCELGVLFQGKPSVSLSADAKGGTVQAQLDAELAKEEDDLQDALDNFQYYPVLALGLSYRF
ncbi:MAG: hypothetical protein OEU95_00960 [Nitrospirota bacterium]|nr:hypothetical protein [Nitrospirota bacterium]